MIATPDLIDALAASLSPVPRLRSPLKRAIGWLLLAALILMLLAIGEGLRPDVAQRLKDSLFIARVLGALATGMFAAVATFILSLPDRSRLWLLLPMPALAVWLSTIGYQCLTNWITVGPTGIRLGETARCFATLVLISLPLSLAMLTMLRYAAPLRPRSAALAGSLAVAAMTAVALSLFHDLDATVMILLWNLGTTGLFIAVGGIFAGRLFSWVAPRSTPFGA